MNETFWWYLARSSGIVALVLLVATLVWGVLLHTRFLKPHDRPAWLLDLHRWLGGTALVMTALHLLGLYLDGYIDYGLVELVVPGASPYRPIGVAVGVVSFYLLVAIQVTSYLRKRLPRRVWHLIHLGSYGLVWGAAVHAGMSGTDVTNRAYQVVAVALTAIAVVATVVRLLSPVRTSRPAPSGR